MISVIIKFGCLFLHLFVKTFFLNHYNCGNFWPNLIDDPFKDRPFFFYRLITRLFMIIILLEKELWRTRYVKIEFYILRRLLSY